LVLENFLIDVDVLWDRVGKELYEKPDARAGRKMRVRVVNRGVVEDLTGYTLNLGWRNPKDETKFGLDVFTAVDITKGIFEIAYTSGMLSNYGVLIGTLQLIPPVGGSIESNNFVITVKRSGVDSEAIQSQNSFTALEVALVQISGWNATIGGKVEDWEADMAVTKQLYIDNMLEVESTYPPRLVSVEQQLAQTNVLSAEAVAKADAMASGSPKGVYTTLALLQAAYPTGTTGAYLVTADGKWYYWNGSTWTIGGTYQSTGNSDKSITENKLAFIPVKGVKGKNLFNKSDVTLNYYIKYNTGALTALAGQSLSSFISAHENTVYYRTTASHTTFWDKNKNYLSGTLLNSFTSPSGTCYIRISMLASTVGVEQLELGSVATPYEEFGTILTDLKKGSIPQETLGELAILREEIEGFSTSANLLNALTLKSGYVVASGAGETVNAEYSVSDYIPINPLTAYTVSNAYLAYASFFDINKNYLSTLSVGVGGDDYTITSVANAYYMRVNIRNTQLTEYMIVEGVSMPIEFVPFGTKFEWLLLEDGSVQYRHMDAYLKNKLDAIDSGKWVGKTFFTFGDSITWYDGQPFGELHSDYGVDAKGYQSYMREKLGCTVINKGVSGNRMPQILTTIKAQSYTGVSAVTMTAGANDFRVTEVTEPFGTIQPIGSTFDETSFTGSLQAAIEYVLGVNPEMKIYLITPIKGWGSSGALEMPNTYSNAMKEIAEMYSLSICDWYGTSGINTLNKTTYIGDDSSLGYYLHPTNIGYERMANILIPFLSNN